MNLSSESETYLSNNTNVVQNEYYHHILQEYYKKCIISEL